MNEGKAIYSILTSDSAVSAIVGYILQNVEPSDTKSGVSTLDEIRYDIVVASETYAEASDLTEKIRTALDRYTGTVAGVVIDSIQFQDIDVDNDPATETFVTSSEYIIRVKR